MIYALIDQETLDKSGASLDLLLSRINSLHIPVLQYRNKYDSVSEKRKVLRHIREGYPGTIIVNDTIELIGDADGLHLGQEDLKQYGETKTDAVRSIRQRIGEKILGLSTHNAAEVKEANSLDIDYIGLGAYRSTGTKRDAKVKGNQLLEIAKRSRHPVAIIGGIRLDDQFDTYITYRVIGSGLYEGLTE